MSKFSLKAIIGFSIVSGAILLSPSAGATATDNADCVTPQGRYSMNVQWNGHDTVVVSTKNNKPVCDDVSLTFSSYTLPATYNGLGFFDNMTSTPQQLFDSVSFTLPAGSSTSAAQTIKLPESCKAHQVDVYYGAPVSVVTQPGFGQSLVDGHIVNKKGECVIAPPVVTTPVEPEEPITPVAPAPIQSKEPEALVANVNVPAVVETATLPAELPKTGNSSITTVLMATVLAGATYAGTLFITTRR